MFEDAAETLLSIADASAGNLESAERHDPRAALVAMSNSMSNLSQLAEQAKNRRVILAVEELKTVVREVLSGERSPQLSSHDTSLMHWAGRHRIVGGSPFAVRGSLISTSIPWMAAIAEQLRAEAGSTALSFEDTKTAGYRTLKACAATFDPGTHGYNFRTFAEPEVRAAIGHCLFTGKLDIPDKPTLEEIQRLCAATKSQMRSVVAPPVHSSPSRRPISDPIVDQKHVEPPTEPEADPPANSSPPPATPRALSPEEVDENKRKRRFCRWAKDEHQIQVTQEQFEEAVNQVAQKFHPLANSIARQISVPSAFYGGGKAVRHEASRLMQEIVREFDPGEGTHITEFVRVRLTPKLEEFVKPKEKKKDWKR